MHQEHLQRLTRLLSWTVGWTLCVYVCTVCVYVSVCAHTPASYLSSRLETSPVSGLVMIWCPAYLPFKKASCLLNGLFSGGRLESCFFFGPPWLFYSFIVGEFKACHAVTPSSLGQQHNSGTQMCLRCRRAGRCRCGAFWKCSST